MNSRRLSTLLVVVSIFALSVLVSVKDLAACEQRPDPQDFRRELAEDAFPQPSGMLLISYGESLNHSITHVTYHRVVNIYPQPALSTVTAPPGQTLVHVDGTLGPLMYVIVTDPLYYGTDLDEMGLPRRVWLDSEEDGINGNEELVYREITDHNIASRRLSSLTNTIR